MAPIEVSGGSVYQADSRDGPWSSELTEVAAGLTQYFRDDASGFTHEVVGLESGGMVDDKRLKKGEMAVVGRPYSRGVKMNPDSLDTRFASILFRGT